MPPGQQLDQLLLGRLEHRVLIAAVGAFELQPEDSVDALLPLDGLHQGPKHSPLAATAAGTECITAAGQQLLQPGLCHGPGEVGQKPAGCRWPGFSQLAHQLHDSAIGEIVVADHDHLLDIAGQYGEQISDGTTG
jgi:hypothetical protein